MRAHLAGLFALFGVLLGAFALPQAAQAADFEGWIASGHDPFIDIGGAAATITVEVKSTFQPGQGPKDVTVVASLEGLDGQASVDVNEGGSCFRSGTAQATCQGMTATESRQIQFIVAPMPESELPEGETQTGKLKVDFGGGGKQETSVTVIGHHEVGPKSVTKVSGVVLSNAEPVPEAKVELTDGEGVKHETTTGGDGGFNFEGSDQGTYIAPGALTLKVTKEGYEDQEVPFDVGEGSSSQQNLTLAKVAAEEETATAEPTTAAAEEPTSAAAVAENEDEGGPSGTLIFLIIVGAVLVIGGIVGIVFLLRGGKDDEDDDKGESFAAGPPEHEPTAAQVGSPGVYQAGPAPGSDAPTMIHNGPLVQDQEVGAYGAPNAGFGPAYGPGSDSTQVMPQAGMPSAPPPAVGPNDTQILKTVKGPGAYPPGPGSDSTQVMPQARPPQNSFSDPGATQPYQPPSPSPTPPGRPGSSMFEPQNPNPASGSQPPASRDPYAPGPSQPDPYAQPSQPSQPPTGFGGPPMSRDPYAPPEQPSRPQPSAPPADPYAPAPTQAMPQGGGYQSQPPSPYADPKATPDEGANSHRRDDEERKGWGEWDDRPRSW